MSASSSELLATLSQLEELLATTSDDRVTRPIAAFEEALRQIKRSFSGSWLGYHANVYYSGLKPAPPYAHFSQEWGLKDMPFSSLGSTGEWEEFDPEEIKQHIRALAGDPDMGTVEDVTRRLNDAFEHDKSTILSMLLSELEHDKDSFLEKLSADLEALDVYTRHQIIDRLKPSGQIMTRDTTAVGQGITVPPHISIAAEILTFQTSVEAVRQLSSIARKAGSHLARKEKRRSAATLIGTNVFIGHGRSPLWKDLKDFVQDRLRLPWDEFNRVPVAGISNTQRLSQMLDSAAFAFLIMTAEDEHDDGNIHARMNVVHEAGLFQGRLGFARAIILLEEGCEEFSNIHGLGQIRFPKGNLKSVLEDVRLVLEREGLIEA